MRRHIEGPVHFIGIGGSGMSGLAEIAIFNGLKVQGSDVKSSHMTHRLENLGAQISYQHTAEGVEGAKTVVYSSAISENNVELSTAIKNGAQTYHRSDFLAWLMEEKSTITIAGTHGKTTTSAMIVHVLDSLGVDPTAVIGGTMREYGSSARTGSSTWFVAEADESDGSFLKYQPLISVLTNIDLDHLDFYKSEANLVSAFSQYIENTVIDGTAIIGWDSPYCRQIGAAFSRSRLTYGLVIGCDIRAIDIKWDGSHTCFKAIVERDHVPIRLKAMGRHNVQNALCALAVTRSLNLSVSAAAAALETFKGVERRLALIFEDENVKIFDDYAHNPGKIAACIEALRTSFPEFPLYVVYQPHRYSRLETMYDAMLSCLVNTHHVFLLPVYAAGETTTQDFSPEKISVDLNIKYKVLSTVCDDIADAADKLIKNIKHPAIILTVGAGDVYCVSTHLKDYYSKLSE